MLNAEFSWLPRQGLTLHLRLCASVCPQLRLCPKREHRAPPKPLLPAPCAHPNSFSFSLLTAHPVFDFPGAIQPYSRGEEEDVSLCLYLQRHVPCLRVQRRSAEWVPQPSSSCHSLGQWSLESREPSSTPTKTSSCCDVTVPRRVCHP